MPASVSLSPIHTLIIGVIFVTFSSTMLWLTLCRYEWTSRTLGGWLCWGCHLWTFPASKMGISYGCIVGIIFGAMCLDSNLQLLPGEIWRWLLLLTLGLAPFIAIHDYMLHRKSKRKEVD